MKQTIIILAAAGIIFSSCSTGKKLKAATAENETLKGQVETLNKQVAEDQNAISQLKAENIQYGNEAEDCRKVKAAMAHRMENLDKALAEYGTSMKQIQEKAAAAIAKFQEDGGDVTYRNGLIHINILDKYFFKSGSSTIGVKGRESLNMLAEVMRQFPAVTATIVGHTDTLPVKGVGDNWSLSVERGAAVVRVLHDLYNINPSRLTAAGKGKYSPKANNDTPEGREKNRRIEIILSPDMARLWELSEDK
ncbi:OmpA/MotB family protein [Flavihumibacter fluvii]|uniref:OmpA/MotB family protein n=1 Tax=Flavihumibacter fluvii TaxID=2838157 RepID=UPI001BDE36CD|nr:OmpA family protein [Flavihumibacter fluvii]ULQ52787.1 OmpA family protein [Flavihumibacter fluvii]